MNKDEAEKCVSLAENALKSGDVDKAVRLLEKSLRMNYSERAAELLQSIRNAQKPKEEPTGATHNEQTSSNSSERQSNESNSQSSGDDGDVVRKVLENKGDYYKLLGIERTATIEVIKRSYKKLALKTHPDKNHSPHSEDAFKLLGQAYACLSKEETRMFYDQHGIDKNLPPSTQNGGSEGMSGMSGMRGTRFYYQRRPGMYQFGDDIDADDLFNFFFSAMGGGVPNGPTPIFRFQRGGNVYRRRRRPNNDDESDEDDDDEIYNLFGQRIRRRRGQPETISCMSVFLNVFQLFLPMFLFGLMFFFLTHGFGGSDIANRNKPFSLSQDRFHPVRAKTELFNVPYYVKRDGITAEEKVSAEFIVNKNHLENMEYQCNIARNGRPLFYSGPVDRHACEKYKKLMKKWKASSKKE